jgi:nicotinate-nucleotide adenylyltransferase
MNPPRKIGLFGGTFDPVHLGHLHLAALAREALDLDEVRFLPCALSPHKAHSSPASALHRAEMLRLATVDIPWAVVDEHEMHQAGPSFSYQTAEAIAGKFPAARLYWIMGGDQWDALPRWEKPERLAACCEFAVLARGGSPQPRDGYTLHIVQGQHPASATAIRQEISNHPWLLPSVAAYIAEHGLYL